MDKMKIVEVVDSSEEREYENCKDLGELKEQMLCHVEYLVKHNDLRPIVFKDEEGKFFEIRYRLCAHLDEGEWYDDEHGRDFISDKKDPIVVDLGSL